MSETPPNFSGDVPRNYDDGMGPVMFAGYADEIARRVSAGAPSRVLETAAGSGIVTRALRDALPAGTHLTATDLNDPMLKVARTKFRAGEQVEFQVADGIALPFPDGSFDTIVCQFGVMFFPNKDKGYREAFRVLTPGGRYLFNVWDAHRYNSYARIGHEVIGSFFPADPPRFFEMPYAYHLIDPIKEALLAAGFDEIRVSVDRQHRKVSDFSTFARGVVFGSPVFEQIRLRGGVDPSVIQDAVAAAMRKEFGGEPGVVPMQAIVFEARKP